jgi:uncharacterized protein YgbK (DUF1537 family)
LNPQQGSYIPALIAEQTQVPVEVTDGSIFSPEDYSHGTQRIIVFDAETDEDLQRIGFLLQEAKQLHLTAGCAGFAAVLADLLELPERLPTQVDCPSQLLVVCGSVNPVSLAQLSYAEKRGFVGFTLNRGRQLDSDQIGAELDGNMIPAIRAALQEDRDVVLSSVCTQIQNHDPLLEEPAAGVDRDQLARETIGFLSRIVKELDDILPRVTLVVIGGDTALGIIQALHISRLYPLQELFPGVALAVTRFASQEIPIVSKAGGFGDNDILIRLKRYLIGAGRC